MNDVASEIKKIPVADLPRLAEIISNAYPAMKLSTPEARAKFVERYGDIQENQPAVNIYGCYRFGTLVGGMLLHDFPLHLLSIDTTAGGVGMVAVDLPYKKEKVALEMIRFYLNHYRQRGVNLAMLYPFRPDFYKAMGFGIGSQMHQYNFAPNSLPKGTSKADVRMLSSSDADDVLACHNTLTKSTHGMTYRRPDEIQSFFANPDHRMAGVWRDGRLTGYLSFSFARVNESNFALHDLHVREYVYHTSSDFLQLMAFLRSQSDQVRRIVLTTPDEDFHHLLEDPRDGTDNLLPNIYHSSSLSGVGLMYRILSVPALFETLQDHDFGGASFSLKLTTSDSLMPEQSGSTILRFEDGFITEVQSLNSAPDTADSPSLPSFDVEVGITIADLSSLLMGSITMTSLLRYDRVWISNPNFADMLQQAFFVQTKPVCWARF